MAMNPAALKVNLADLSPGGLIIADTGAFDERNLEKAGYAVNPLEDATLAPYQVVAFDITRLTLDAVKPFGLRNREALRCKNMWALGLVLWMFDRDREPVIDWLRTKFGAKSEVLVAANIAALNAGHFYGETAELRPAAEPSPHRTGSDGTRALPHCNRRRGDRPGPRCRQPTRFVADVSRFLSDHSGEPDLAPSGAAQGI